MHRHWNLIPRWQDVNAHHSRNGGARICIRLFLVIHAVVVLPPFFLAFSMSPHARGYALTIAYLLGLAAACCAIVQYFPQLYRTYTSKHPGALSIPMMCIQTPGGFLLVYALSIKPDTNWTTWISILISAVSQAILLVMCIKYRHAERQRHAVVASERADGRLTPAGAYWEDGQQVETDGLLDSDAAWSDDDVDLESGARMGASEAVGVFVSPIGSYSDHTPTHPRRPSAKQ